MPFTDIIRRTPRGSENTSMLACERKSKEIMATIDPLTANRE
jgi:hypothetical protein